MSSSRRLLFRVFAVVAALVLAGGRAERPGQRSSDEEMASFGDAARAFVIQAANADVFHGTSRFSKGFSALAPVSWTPSAPRIGSPRPAPTSVGAGERVGGRVRRRILRMESDEPPLANTGEVVFA